MNLTSEGQLTIDKTITLKPYQARPFKSYELATDDEILANAGSDAIIDTENYLNYFLIAFSTKFTYSVFFTIH